MATAQERTLSQYHGLMRVNASAHLLRVGRHVGLIGELRKGQRTAEQLGELLEWSPHSATLLIDGLIAIGVIEQYGEDYALSRAGHLLCQYDEDLGDAMWDRLGDVVRGGDPRKEHDDGLHYEYLAATQWSHTASAMQAAEMLDVGQGGEFSNLRILDLGCGSGVWSCAIAHRDPESCVVAVDTAASLEAARVTAESIEIADRFETIEANPIEVELKPDEFDLVLIAQRLSCLDAKAGQKLLNKAVAATKPGGRVVVIDLYRGPTKPNLVECIEALKLDLGTRGGRMRSLEEVQADLREAGLTGVQFSFLAASEIHLGLALGTKAPAAGGKKS